MKKYVVGDLHGATSVYQTIMSYLEEVRKEEDLILYIDGDLIDRGPGSTDMLLDVYDKIKNKTFPIEYLAGNHELMMMETFQGRVKGIVNSERQWYRNGGKITDDGLVERLKTKEKILEVVDFIEDRKLYEELEERLQGKRIALVHAECPYDVEKNKNKRLKDIDDISYFYLWAREEDPNLPFRCRIGHKDYFSIVGHTPNCQPSGFQYNKRENYLNIDGGCSMYVCGYTEVNHVPLVEINDDYLKILTFNHQGELIEGNWFEKEAIPFSEEELKKEKVYVKK